jgi:hypothetical protein
MRAAMVNLPISVLAPDSVEEQERALRPQVHSIRLWLAPSIEDGAAFADRREELSAN